MASLLQLPRLLHRRLFSESDSRKKVNGDISYSKKFDGKASFFFLRERLPLQFLAAIHVPSKCGALSAMSSDHSSQTDCKNGLLVAEAHEQGTEFNRVNCLVWVLHESARSFSLAVESLKLPGTSAELIMAWNGKDVHMWHKQIAYKVAVYALLKTAIEVEILLSHDRHSNPSPVSDILTPKTNLMGEYIESQLNMRHSELVHWFRVVELPCIAGFFAPLLKKWSMEYAGSGVAGVIVAISCCAAVGKLGCQRISCPVFALSINDILVELMNFSHSLVSVDKLYQLATEAGFELDFLSHFGVKVLPTEKSEELEFWIGLAHKKLSVAFQNEGFIPYAQKTDAKALADSLATLGLFAYLGRRTRLFLSKMGINDLDQTVKDFLSYLECGSLFIYGEFSSISVYQFFMEVVIDEIGWLDFYAAFPSVSKQERRRCKQYTIQAEKEIILSSVLTICYDVFSGFAHFSRSTQQHLKTELLAFLIRSQSLLTICLEDYWAAYDRSGELQKIAAGPSDHILSNKSTTMVHVALDAQEKPTDLVKQEYPKNLVEKASSSDGKAAVTFVERTFASKSNPVQESLIKKYSTKLISTSTDVWMGTQLLFVDIMISMELLGKQMHGQKVSARERKKLKRTLNDIALLIPVTILMLLPVSAVGHAAMLAAIRKYFPVLIPSPYSSERMDVVKQLERTKKMNF